MVFLAAKQLGCTAKTIYKRSHDVAEVAEAIEHARGEFHDTAEMKLYDAVQAGEPWAVRLALTKRGYGSKVAVEAVGTTVELVHEIVTVPTVLDAG